MRLGRRRDKHSPVSVDRNRFDAGDTLCQEAPEAEEGAGEIVAVNM